MGLEIRSGPAPSRMGRAPRRYSRAMFTVPITLRHLMAGGVRATPGVSLDISEGGLGAIVQSALQVGETVEVELPLPGGKLSAVAIVRHASSVCCGFEFLGLTGEERLQIASAASS